jgi:cytochrome c biogenesis protein CcdA
MNSRITRLAATSVIAAVIAAMGFGAVNVSCFAPTAASAVASASATNPPVPSGPDGTPWG